MDQIIIKGLRLFAYHGVNPEEKEQGQDFVFDIVLSVNMNRPCSSDQVEDTVSYAKVVKTVRRVFTAEKYNLIEKVRGCCCQSGFGRISCRIFG